MQIYFQKLIVYYQNVPYVKKFHSVAWTFLFIICCLER